jgi:dTDP-4-dehydrorhamnose 3,5-epimerase
MKIIKTKLPEVLIIEPTCFKDDRGFFLVSYQEEAFRQELGLDVSFIQDNHSRSSRHVLRGLHYQVKHPQGKLVRVVTGAVYDVAVDIRKDSPHFGQWFGLELSAENHKMLWIPPGFAHGFLVLSDYADFLYKVTDIYAPQYERTLMWNDPDVSIDWPLNTTPELSEKDKQGLKLSLV